MQKNILDFFKSNPSGMYKTKDISRKLNIPKHKYMQLRDALRQLVREGQLIKLKKNKFALASANAEIVGKLHVNSQGYGFVSREDGEDIFISQKNMSLALHNDVVQVRLFATSRGKSPEGMITKVIERVHNKIVGTFIQGKYYSYVVPDDLKFNRDIVIAHGEEQGAQDGEKVVVTIAEWEHHQLNPAGKIVEILGPPDKAGVDILSLVHHYNLSETFPDKIMADAEKIPDDIPTEELERRLDLRNEIVFTIDPEDAKDFDDAISLKRLENGNVLLGVHIADVSYYVQPKSDLDREALERGTSVYLVDRVIPMLPERISNHLCSLVEGKDRLCYSVMMELRPNADMVSFEIKESVIHSHKRLTYQQAQHIMDGKLESDLAPVLKDMYAVYKKLLVKRDKRGGVDFDSLEIYIDLDEQGHPTSIRRRERLDAHRLIEEFMLLANETVASFVGEKIKQETGNTLPFVYRIHDVPSEEKITELINLIKAFGYNTKPPKKITPQFFQKLSEMFKKNQSAVILQDSLIRSMMKAQYSTKNVGHFGLAYSFYTHFTSPIRRYPDLLVHRLLKRYAVRQEPFINQKELQRLCVMCSDREVQAVEAERASVKLKQTEFMERHLGSEFSGFITRLLPFGFFVEIPELLVDGLVHVKTMDDYYVLDEKKYKFVGRASGKSYKLGDKVNIRVSHVDRNERIIDFVLV